jgi:predicted transcriptional regulator
VRLIDITIPQLRMARAALGWSQGELARRAGVSRTTVADLERGHGEPRLATMRRLVAALEQAGAEIGDDGAVRIKQEEPEI